MKKIFIPLMIVACSVQMHSTILKVGTGQQYATLQSASVVAVPGDTILFVDKNIQGGMFVSGLKGLPGKQITITSESRTVISGGGNAIQFSDVNWITISNLIIEGQTGNGINIDDGGSYDTPTTNIILDGIEFWELNATGNNDQLKMSGVDSFLISDCTFSNSSEGGSMIDMVGCHQGIIRHNQFTNGGSNAIQAKGASYDITIMQNTFKNAGQRAINIGGSTGAAFFRPLNAKYESKDIKVWSNFFSGSLAPIAFVGTVNSEVVNNTIYNPDKWVIRILQENVESGMDQCSNNKFINNIVVVGNKAVNPSVNIGPNTQPETFTFENNLWYNFENPNWSGPALPSIEKNAILRNDPLVADIQNGNIHLKAGSPAIGKAKDIEKPIFDFYGNIYRQPRSIGAAEDTVSTEVNDKIYFEMISITPNPAMDFIEINIVIPAEAGILNNSVKIYNFLGEMVLSDIDTPPGPLTRGGVIRIDVSGLPQGVYFVSIGNHVQRFVKY